MGGWDSFSDALSRPLPHPVGTRIRLVAMGDDPDRVPSGSEGTITGGNAAQIYVEWDNGRTLMLLPEFDRYEVIGKVDGT